MRISITIPVFYHENDEGHKVLDVEYMREYFENQVKHLYLETKIGRREHWEKVGKQKLKNIGNESK